MHLSGKFVSLRWELRENFENVICGSCDGISPKYWGNFENNSMKIYKSLRKFNKI